MRIQMPSTPNTGTVFCASLSSDVPPRSLVALPFNERERIMNELDTQKPAAASQVAGRGTGKTPYSEPALTPPVDVVEDSTGITLYADLPGVSKDKLHLQVEADTLTIDAESDLAVPEALQISHT